MDPDRFDRFARLLAAMQTRRKLVRILAGVTLGGALVPARDHLTQAKRKKKSCGPCKIRKKGKCKKNRPNGTDCGDGNTCQNGACGCFPSTRVCDDLCCPQGQVCDQASGQCANAGACPAQTGLDCSGPTITCNGRSTCFCSLATDDTTRCATPFEGSLCDQCTDDDDCVALVGDPNAFCAKTDGVHCCGAPGQTVCRRPCPA